MITAAEAECQVNPQLAISQRHLCVADSVNPPHSEDISQNPPFSVFVGMKIIEIFILIKISMV